MPDDRPIVTSVRISPRAWAAMRALAREVRPKSNVSRLVSVIIEDVVSGRIDVPWLAEARERLPSQEVLEAAIAMRHPDSLATKPAIPRRNEEPVMEVDEADLEVAPKIEVPEEVRGITGRWNKHLPKGFVVSFQDLAVSDPRVKANAGLVAGLRRPLDPEIAYGFLQEGRIDPRQFRDLVGTSKLREFVQDEARFPVGSEGREKLLAMSYADMRRDQAALIDVARAEEPRLSQDEEMLPPKAKFQAMVDRGVDRGKLKDFLVREFETKHCPKCGEADLNGEPSFFGLVNPDGRVKCGLCRAFMHAGRDLPLR